MQCLCEQGADKEVRSNYGITPLHWASEVGTEEDTDYSPDEEEQEAKVAVKKAAWKRVIATYLQALYIE